MSVAMRERYDRLVRQIEKGRTLDDNIEDVAFLLADRLRLTARLNEAREALEQTDAWLSDPNHPVCPNQPLHSTVVRALASITVPEGPPPYADGTPRRIYRTGEPTSVYHHVGTITDPEGGDK